MSLSPDNPIVRVISGYVFGILFLSLVAAWFLMKRLPALIRSTRGANWPIANGKVETVRVKTFAEQSLAEIGYSYLVEGERYAGYFARQFAEGQDAWSYATPLKGQSVTVRYKPGAPAISALRLDDQSSIFHSSRRSFTGGLFRVLFQNFKN